MRVVIGAILCQLLALDLDHVFHSVFREYALRAQIADIRETRIHDQSVGNHDGNQAIRNDFERSRELDIGKGPGRRGSE